MNIKSEYSVIKLELDNYLFNALKELNHIAHVKDISLHDMIIDLDQTQEEINQVKKIDANKVNQDYLEFMKIAEDAIMKSAKLIDDTKKMLLESNSFVRGVKIQQRDIEDFVQLPDVKLNCKLKKMVDKPNYFDPNLDKKKNNVDQSQQVSETVFKDFEVNHTKMSDTSSRAPPAKLSPQYIEFKNQTLLNSQGKIDDIELISQNSSTVANKISGKTKRLQMQRPSRQLELDNQSAKTKIIYNSHLAITQSNEDTNAQFEETFVTNDCDKELKQIEIKLLKNLNKYK